MYPNSIYFGPKNLYRDYFKAKVYAIWVHGPLGLGFRVLLQGHVLGMRDLGSGFRLWEMLPAAELTC